MQQVGDIRPAPHLLPFRDPSQRHQCAGTNLFDLPFVATAGQSEQSGWSKLTKSISATPAKFHTPCGIPSAAELLTNPNVGASWEGFALEEIMQAQQPDQTLAGTLLQR